jgi:membrane protein
MVPLMRDPAESAGTGDRSSQIESGAVRTRAVPRRSVSRLRRRVGGALKRFWRLAWEANITGLSAMVAYSMLLAVIPIALLGLFIAGQVLSSEAVQRSVLTDLQGIFPGAAEGTLNSLLNEVRDSTTSTGVLAFIGALWLGSSFWGALDTAFGHVYRCRSRSWLDQKRFAFVMLIVVLLFMVATVAVPIVQAFLLSGAEHLPFDLAKITDAVYVVSLIISLILLFSCLGLIYTVVPNLHTPWRAVWPGAISATLAIGVIDYVFPFYFSNISTIARFGTTIVFVLIVLAWFYVVALIILGGAVINSLRLRRDQVARRP